MKKTITIMSMAMIGLTVNAQNIKDLKMIKMDKSQPLQVLTVQPKIVTAIPPPVIPSTIILTTAKSDKSNAPATVNEYFMKLPGWPAVGAPSENKGPKSAPQPTTEEFDAANQPLGKQIYECTTYPVDITTAPEKIITMDPNFSALWLGALIQGKGLSKGIGSIAELPLRKRNPLRISTSLIGVGATEIEIPNPDPGSVRTGISRLILAANASGVPQSKKALFDLTESTSLEASLLHLHLSANFFGTEAKATLDVQVKANKHTFLAYFYENAFAVSIQNPSSPGDFFRPELTLADIEQQKTLGTIGRDNIPVCLSRINYGRILFVRIISDSSYDKVKAAVEASYTGSSVGGRAEFTTESQRILSNAEFHVVAIGGNETGVIDLIRTGHLSDYFNTPPSLSTYQPVSYEFTNIINGTSARFLESTHFEVTECKPVPNKPVDKGDLTQICIKSLTIKGDWDWQWGDDHKIDLYGRLEVDGKNVWSNELTNRDPFSPSFTFKDKQNNYADGEVIGLEEQGSKFVPEIRSAVHNIPAVNGKEFKNDDDAFNITGMLGDWDLVTSAESIVNVSIPYAAFKNDASLYGRPQTFEIKKNIELDHPASIIVTYVVKKIGDINEYTIR